MTDPAPLPPAPAGDKPGTIAMLRMVGALREQVGRKIRMLPLGTSTLRPMLERAQLAGERLDFTAMDAMTQARVAAAVLADTAERLRGLAPGIADDLAGGSRKLIDALEALELEVAELVGIPEEVRDPTHVALHEATPGGTRREVAVVALVPGSDPPPDLVAKYGESTVRALARPLPTSLLADVRPAGFAAGGMIVEEGRAELAPDGKSFLLVPKAAKRPHADDLEEHLRRVGEAAGEGDGKPPEDVPF